MSSGEKSAKKCQIFLHYLWRKSAKRCWMWLKKKSSHMFSKKRTGIELKPQEFSIPVTKTFFTRSKTLKLLFPSQTIRFSDFPFTKKLSYNFMARIDKCTSTICSSISRSINQNLHPTKKIVLTFFSLDLTRIFVFLF